MFSDEHLYSIALRRCNLIGDINFFKLLRETGSAQDIWKTPKKQLAKMEGFGTRTLADIGNPDHLHFAEKELKFCEKNGVDILLRHQNQLPRLLQQCEDAPSLLYMKGKFPQDRKALSIVGTRNVTHYGKQFIEDLFENLMNRNLVTVSGLALGVDAEVHSHSLKNNIPTVGVLAHGFHTFYPARNKKLADKILENEGALLTEFNSSQKPDRENFIQRNRIIAGLSKATIVIETAFGGGSVSTVTFANDYNRDVFALPGKITDKYSQGCNQMIMQNKAAAISTIKDLLKDLGLTEERGKMAELFPTSETRLQLTDNQNTILQIIINNPHISLDEIFLKTEIPSHKILSDLLNLELSGYVKSLSGKQFLAR